MTIEKKAKLPMLIPYTNYALMPHELRKEILVEISKVIQLKDACAHEHYVAEVEMCLAKYIGIEFGIAVDSGTTALQLALTALGVKAGDEVLVPTYTYVATALAVSNLGARPVFVDVKESDLTINPDRIRSSITSKTKAVIPVHIHGLCCDIHRIQDICSKHGLALVEDASQAHGAMIGGRKVGSFGVGCFSMHTSKNLGGIGDAGFIALNREEVYKEVKQLLVPDSGAIEVLESRRTPCIMDAMQAAIIKRKLLYLDEVNKRKRDIAGLYDALIRESKVKKIVPLQGSNPVYRDYCVLVDDRDVVRDYLLKKGVESKPGYAPLNMLKTFQVFRGSKKDYPISSMIAKQALCLPSFFGITDKQIQYVSAVLQDYL